MPGIGSRRRRPGRAGLDRVAVLTRNRKSLPIALKRLRRRFVISPVRFPPGEHNLPRLLGARADGQLGRARAGGDPPTLARTMAVPNDEETGRQPLPSVTRLERLVNVALGQIQTPLLDLDRGVRQLRVGPQQTAQIGAADAQFGRGLADIDAVPAENLDDNVSVQMLDAVGNDGLAMEVRSRSWVDQLLLELRDAAPPGDEERTFKRSLNRSPSIQPATRPRIDARGAISIQPGEALRRGQQMSILGGGGLHTIPQSARPDALAAGRPIVEQPKPLRAAATPRAHKHRPEAAVPEGPRPDADPVFDAVVTELDKRRPSITPDVAVRHQRGHANERQIFNSGPHAAETYCFSDQHSMLLCMIRPSARHFTRCAEPKPASALLFPRRQCLIRSHPNRGISGRRGRLVFGSFGSGYRARV